MFFSGIEVLLFYSPLSPVEQPTKVEFVINLKMAKQIGLTIPPEVFARATKLIK